MKLPKRLGCLEEHRDLPPVVSGVKAQQKSDCFIAKTKFNRRATGCTAPVQCTPLHGQEKLRKNVFSTFARSVNYTRVIHANDHFLLQKIGTYVSTWVVPGRGTHGLN